MKSLSFTKCLENAQEILRDCEGILYFSMGAFLKNNASIEKTHLQQAPLFILKSTKPSVIILVDPLFLVNDPIYIERLKEYNVRETGTKVIDPAYPKTTFMKCGEFLQDGSNALQKLVKMMNQNPMLQFYIGDFTLTQPCVPFNEYPIFYKKLQCMPNVWLSQSCTREKFINATFKCQIMPSPYTYTP